MGPNVHLVVDYTYLIPPSPNKAQNSVKLAHFDFLYASSNVLNHCALVNSPMDPSGLQVNILLTI